MRPVLFHIGSFPVYSYTIFVVLAYLAGLAYAWQEARRQKQDPVHVLDLGLVIFISGIAGARLLFVLIDYKRFLSSPLDVFKIWQGGLVYYGGLILAAAAAAVYLKVKRLPLGLWADILAPTAMLALAYGRIGCFLNGCCYGRPAPDLAWAVVYPPSHPSLLLGLGQVPVHPTPIYSSLAALVIFLLLLLVQKRKRFQGQTFFMMLLFYSVARFVIEFFRGDPRGTVPVLQISTSQFISLVSWCAAVAFLVRGYRGGASLAGPNEEARKKSGLEQGGAGS